MGLAAKNHIKTDESSKLVAELASFGITHFEIATHLRIDERTLKRRYEYELKDGTTQANMKVARVLFKKAVVDEDTACCIFWLKTRGKWRDKEDNRDSDVLSVAERLLDRFEKK